MDLIKILTNNLKFLLINKIYTILMNIQTISKQLQQYQNIESILFTTDYSHFDNFLQMENFLQCADQSLTTKIDDLQAKMNLVHEEYIRTSTVYEINNKKRAKQQQLLMIERKKIKQQLQIHQKRLQIPVQPITLVVKQKHKQIKKLNQTKQIIQGFNKLIKGDQFQIKKLIPLDDKNFKDSALKIFIYKQLIQAFDNPDYQLAKNQIRKKFAELKNKILINFKQGFWKKDLIHLKMNLPYCQQYDLMQEISDFYNQQIFKQCHKISKITNDSSGQSQIKNFFFLLQRAFNYAFTVQDKNTGQKNSFQIYQILSQYSDIIGRRLITFGFQKLIKQSIQNVLKSTINSGLYLSYLQIFYTECKSLLKNTQVFIKDQRVIYLMTTYFQSTFDTYLETYLIKQTNFLTNSIQQQMNLIVQQIKNAKIYHKQTLQIDTNKKFSIKKIIDFKIQKQSTHNPDAIKLKIQTLNNIFNAAGLQKIFMTTKKSLLRNMKISKLNDVDKNRNDIVAILIKNLTKLLDILISTQFYVISLKYRIDCPWIRKQQYSIGTLIFSNFTKYQFDTPKNGKQAKYHLAEALKLQQKKEALITGCQKKLNKILGDALANILTVQNSILKFNETQYYIINPNQKVRQPSQATCNKVISLLEKYLRPINKINLQAYKNNILKTLGVQFINLLISYYGKIPYTKQGLSLIFIDIANYKKIIIQIDFPEVQQKYKSLRSLIDIYVIKNQEKAINTYLKTQKEGALKYEKDQTIKQYIINKMKYEKL